MFSGLVFCDDCKQKLYYSTTNYFEKRQDFFICSTHRANKDKCSGHYIRAVVLEEEVWKHIQEVIAVVTRYEAYFRSEMEQKLRVQSEEMLLYKDSYGINHRSAIAEKLKELAQIVVEDNYDEVLLPHPRRRYCHDDKHLFCTMLESPSQERPTEKRICRCWCYFNKEDKEQDCSACKFSFKKSNVGNFQIADYEVPTEFAMEQLGGIDWLLKHDGRLIAAEVKPPNSSETIVRMIAEILTYTIGTAYVPAICFFKTDMGGNPSKQYIDYLKYKDNQDFQLILSRTGLEVLYVTFDKDTFSIHNVKDEPI